MAQKAIDIFQSQNKRSLYSLSPKEVQKAMRRVPRPILLMDEKQLEEVIIPTPTMRLLRYRYWDEYQKVHEDHSIEGLDLEAICRGICNPQFLVEKVFNSDHLTAWMVLPPKSYEDAMEETLAMGVLRLREIFEIPIIKKEHIRDEAGNIVETETTYDSKAANLILRAYGQVDQRVKGGFVQRHQIQTQNVGNQIKEAKQVRSMEEIEARLKTIDESDRLLEASTVKENPVKQFQAKEPEGEDQF